MTITNRMVSSRVKGKLRALVAAGLLGLGCALTPAHAKNFVITLDAGHGGKDYGAVGDEGNEKSITLNVVLALGHLIESNIPETKVVYTRSDDNFVELSDRAHIANKASSDLFMSVHVNSVDKKNRNRRSIAGCQVYTLGLHRSDDNLAVAKRENSVMELEPDHTQKYAGFDPNSLESDIVFELAQAKRLDQSIEFADAIYHQLIDVAGREPRGVRQAGFWVLWATSMPSVLVELDFICNPTSEHYMLSDTGQQEMVAALYNAFCAYYNTYAPQILGHAVEPVRGLSPKAAKAPKVPSQDAQPSPSPSPSPSSQKSQAAASPMSDPSDSSDSSDTSTSPSLPPVPSNPSPTFYIQLLASTEPLTPSSTELKGLQNVNYYKEGQLLKYVVSPSDSQRQAKRNLKELRSKFPEAFIVKIVEGKRTDFIKP